MELCHREREGENIDKSISRTDTLISGCGVYADL